MLAWDHGGGFSLDGSVRIEATDRTGLERLIRSHQTLGDLFIEAGPGSPGSPVQPTADYRRSLDLADGIASTSWTDGGMKVRRAAEGATTLLIGGATDYGGEDPLEEASSQVEAACRRDYADLRASHVDEHRSLFESVSLDLGSTPPGAERPTEARLEELAQGADVPVLFAQYFRFGRYLLMGSPRPGTLSANLLGIGKCIAGDRRGLACCLSATYDPGPPEPGGRRSHASISGIEGRGLAPHDRETERETWVKRVRSLLALFVCAIFGLGVLLPGQAMAQDAPPRVIFFVGDGAGAAYWTAASLTADRLAVESFPVGGLVETGSSDSKVTDSAAAGTAFSAGIRTYNGAIGVDPDTVSVTTVLEIAQRRGMATGLVATSSITHATPAAFASHVENRNMEFEIARQLAAAEVDVILGGGRRFFSQSVRPDSVDLLSDVQARYPYIGTAAELADLETEGIRRLFGLFADAALPAAAERAPTLPAMTRAALEVLDHDPDGFFLMVEASQPDWRGHDREPLDILVAEMLDLDRAVGVALEYQKKHPETLIVVTGDHETGGLAVQQAWSQQLLTRSAEAADSLLASLADVDEVLKPETAAVADSTSMYLERLSGLLRRQARRTEDSPVMVARYTTGSHTAQMVPLFASGPGAEIFGGIKENWRIGELLRAAVER